MSDRKLNVLIVDDDETIVWTLSNALRRQNPNLQTYMAMNGREALGYIRQLKYLDMLITDIHMPDLSGIDLLVRLQDLAVKPEIIVITGYGSSEVHSQVEELGAVRYWTKPFDINELARDAIEILNLSQNRRKHPGFKGSFTHMRMVDLVQINCLIQSSGLLKVKSGSRSGKVYFWNGDIVHAETAIGEGEEALYEIIDWGSGEFELVDQVAPEKQTIHKSWEFLLIEHSRRKDQRDYKK
ncbi:response regulator [bacterium]|nr:response regulator [candidate division CSSED10-310 bacterium]